MLLTSEKMWPGAVRGSGTCWCMCSPLKPFTPWCLKESLEKGTQTAKTDTKLVKKNSVVRTVPKDTTLELEKPAVQPGNGKTVWLCQESVFPGINYCFLITAFPLQLLLANLLYLGLHWWLIKFQSRWLQSSGWFPPARYGWVCAGRAEKGTVNSVSWE